MELIRHEKSHGFYQNHFLDSRNPRWFIVLTVFNWFALSFLYSFSQELAKMQVRDAVIIIFGEERSHGDNVLH